MDDRVEIPIITTADTKGAQQTAAALGQVEQATQAHGEAAQEAGKKAEFLGLKHGELRKTVRELGREFPLAGAAARAMMNPVVAAITLAIGLFAKAKQALADWNAEMDKASEAAANPDFLAGINAQKAALQSGRVAQSQFAESLHTIATAQDDVQTKVAETINRLHELIAAQTEVNSAGEAKELAGVNLNEKLGKVKPEQAIIQRSAIRQRYAKINEDLKTQGEVSELQAKQSALAEAQAAQPGLEAAAKVKQEAAVTLKGRIEKARTDSKAAEENLKKAEDEMRKLLEEEAKAQNGTFATFQLGHEVVEDAIREKIAKARVTRDRAKHTAEELKKFADEGDTVLPFVSGDAEAAANAAKANEQGIRTLQKQIGTEAAAQSIRQKGRGVASGLKSETEAADTFEQLAQTDTGKLLTEGSNEAHIMIAAKAAQRAKDSGKPIAGGDAMIKAAQDLSANQNNAVNQLATYLKKGDQSWDKFLQMLESLTSNQAAVLNRLNSLEQMIRQIDTKSKFVGNR